MKLGIVSGSTRQGRVTPKLARWVERAARNKHDDVAVYDLADYDIAFLQDAPWAPSHAPSEGEQRWLNDLASVDGLIIVTPEYNHSMPAALKNALDLTLGQLHRKPVGIVSHGVVGGARSSETLRVVLGSKIGAAVVPDSVAFHGNADKLLDDEGVLLEDDANNNAALDAQLDELLWYMGKLR